MRPRPKECVAVLAAVLLVAVAASASADDESSPPQNRVTGATRDDGLGRARLAKGLFELDAQAGGSLRGWKSQSYPTLDVSGATFWTYQVDVRASFFDVIHLHKLYYESNAIGDPTSATSSVQTQKTADSLAWLVAMLGIPVYGPWDVYADFETLSLTATASPKTPVIFVPNDATHLGAPSTTPVTMGTTFQKAVVGGMFRASTAPGAGALKPAAKGEPTQPILYYLGLGTVSYDKPYMLRDGDKYYADWLFDTQFRGLGLAAGSATHFFSPGAESHFTINGQVGEGHVQLTNNATVGSGLVPLNLNVFYAELDASLNILATVIHGPPTLSLGGGGSAELVYFYAMQGTQQESASPINWDVFWSLRALATMSL